MSQPVSLTPKQQELVDRLVQSGRFHGANDVIAASLELLEERERQAAGFVSKLEDEIAKGLQSKSAPMESAAVLMAQFRNRR